VLSYPPLILRPAIIGFSLAVAIVLALIILPQRATDPSLSNLPPRLYPMYSDKENDEDKEEMFPRTLIHVLKTPKTRDVTPGNTIDFQIAIQNTTLDTTLNDLIVEELYDESQISISSDSENTISQNKITWNIQELKPRQIRSINYSMRIKEDAPIGSMETTAYVLGEDLKNMSSSSRMTTSILTVIKLPPAGVELGPVMLLISKMLGR